MKRFEETVWVADDGQELLRRSPSGRFNVVPALAGLKLLEELRKAIDAVIAEEVALKEDQ